jgi:hypothetical protein
MCLGLKKKIMIAKPTKHQNEMAIVSFCDSFLYIFGCGQISIIAAK